MRRWCRAGSTIWIQIRSPPTTKLSVHDVVDDGVVERGLVEDGHVPRDEDDDPDGVADPGAEEKAERAAQPADPRQRHEQVAREQEDAERPADGDDGERDPEVGDEDVLQHVDALQVALADRVDRRHDREHGHEHAGDEERDPRPGREARAAAVEPQPAVQEERDRDDAAADHERLERPRAPEVLGREQGAHTVRLTASRQACGRLLGHARRDRKPPVRLGEYRVCRRAARADRALHVHVADAGEVGARPVDGPDGPGQVGP